jgi:hypothetical protein
MKTIEFHLAFDYADDDLAQLLAKSTPPQGVVLSTPSAKIEAGATGGVFTEIVFSLALGVAGNLLAAWIIESFKKSPKKTAQINRKNVALKESAIARFINEEIAKNTTKPEKPTAELIEFHLHRWDTLENYRLQEQALGLLFQQLCPRLAEGHSVEPILQHQHF